MILLFFLLCYERRSIKQQKEVLKKILAIFAAQALVTLPLIF